MNHLIRFCMDQKLVVILLTIFLVGWGIAVAPFDWKIDWLPRDPVPVDAIPNLGENQQIVFTAWEGRSPRDVEDQVTYPLTVALLGVPGVREVRSLSMFGFSSVFIIFEEDIEFYWSRSRITERLNSLPPDTLPPGVQPALGPDATALGQIFWYTLEGRDPDGNPAGGWDQTELRGLQDWYVRFALQSAEGISEVASIGGFVNEYQVDVDPDKLRVYGVTLGEVTDAVRKSNLDVSAGPTEINRVEYLVRGIGFIRALEDIEKAVVWLGPDNTPVRVRDVATVARGPGERRGALTVEGAEAVGAVVAVREGYNPLQALNHVRDRITEIRPGLPARAVIDWSRAAPDAVTEFARANGLPDWANRADLTNGADEAAAESWERWLREHPRDQWPEWLTLSTVTIVPFYDRTGLIYETLGTLNDALVQQALVTIVVVLVMLLHLRAAVVVSAMLPLSILMAFIAMKLFGVEANVVALAGIAIAIGTIVDMGIIVTENVLRQVREAAADESRRTVILRAAGEVGPAILTAISTTVVSFLPVFTMTGAEGKMFVPLAFTKTFVLIASIIVALTIVPVALHLVVARDRSSLPSRLRQARWFVAGLAGAAVFAVAMGMELGWASLAGALLALAAITMLLRPVWGPALDRWFHARPAWKDRRRRASAWAWRSGHWLALAVALFVAVTVLARVWEPLGPERGFPRNFLFVVLVPGGLLGFFALLRLFYEPALRWVLAHKALFLAAPALLIVFGATVWLGFDRVMGWLPATMQRVGIAETHLTHSRPWVAAAHAFPGLGREFLPRLDEGAFLWMPTTMPHASLGEALEVVRYQDQAIGSVPEIETVVGKIGRAESALDPAPVSMIESLILYKPEYKSDDAGRRINFRYDRRKGEFERDEKGELIPDPRGRPYRQWRDEIRSSRDIWNELAKAAELPGTTSAPPLQPIETRLVMLQTGMRAAMGLKIRAPDLDTLDRMAVRMESLLREVPQIEPATVNADRVVGKPYLEIHIDRDAIARYGLNITDVQEVITTAIGGMAVTTTVEGRERYPVRIRYPRERRNLVEDMENVLLAVNGAHIPLREVAEIRYERGPQMIRSEDTFPVAYVTFGKRPGFAEVDVVEAAAEYLQAKIDSGDLIVPPGGNWKFAGAYEHQLRAARTLSVVLPVALGLIFLILYFQFRSTATTFIVFSSILVAWAGGFIMLYFYGQDWFANFDLFGVNVRELFQLHPVNLSVAVWVGFLALFGIAVDDGVVMTTYLNQSTAARSTRTVTEIREAVVAGALHRVRPCLMTTATTVLALLPVLTSTGRGADLMIPMALPSVGGMFFVLIALFTVPALYCLKEELRVKYMEGED